MVYKKIVEWYNRIIEKNYILMLSLKRGKDINI